MSQFALLPEDVKQIIAGYYGETLKPQIQNDIIDYSTYIRELVTNINRRQIQYKLLFWKILHTFHHSPNIPKKYDTIPPIGYIWGIMNHIERTNFIRYIL
jgi:hypothetical protein